MNIEIIDWCNVIREIAQEGDMTVTEVGKEAGLAGSALSALNQTNKPAEPSYSEGHELIMLYYRYCDHEEIPTIKRSHDVICMACQRLRPRGDIMKIKTSTYRCITCIDRAKERKGIY